MALHPSQGCTTDKVTYTAIINYITFLIPIKEGPSQ